MAKKIKVERDASLKAKHSAEELPPDARLRLQEQIRQFRGKLKWTGNLDAMRTDR